MSFVILDPTDPTMCIIGNAAEPIFGVQAGATTLHNVHLDSVCAGNPCCIHNPSGHHMRGWKLNWRDDRGLMERICPHGTGHPDPDDVAYHERADRRHASVHGCDGCCEPHWAA